jgi:DNA polymerase
VFICNVLKCRPPGNRDPLPGEIENCQAYLMRQVELIQPRVICTLGNFAMKLLRGEPTGISRLHGQAEIRVIGERAVRLYPLFHPAAALYTRSLLDTLRADFARLPGLLELPLPEQPERAEPDPEPEPAVPEPEVAAEPEPQLEPESPDDRQLGLF